MTGRGNRHATRWAAPSAPRISPAVSEFLCDRLWVWIAADECSDQPRIRGAAACRRGAYRVDGTRDVFLMPYGLETATSCAHPGLRLANIRSGVMSMTEQRGSPKSLPGPHSQAYQPIPCLWHSSKIVL